MRAETLYHSNLLHKNCPRYMRLYDRIPITYHCWKNMKMKKEEKKEEKMEEKVMGAKVRSTVKKAMKMKKKK